MKKTCFKCNTEKPLEEFYKHPQMADGRLNKCRECAKKDALEHRQANLARVQDNDRQRHRKSEKHKASVRAYAQKHPEKLRRAKAEYSRRNPNKKKAAQMVSNAIRNGRLLRQPCEKCGNTKAEAHHDNYSKPLDVRWLCDMHHKEHHRNLRDEARKLAA